ncbi:DsbA family protein [Bailinhaonella thermotolerans]|uniref:Protein-disulfide isomerase n=1 Tax=Bailinhaonella thermotolerans TaxID=1070861 RepID=A0A3A4AZ93_9ACTN|nr:thioredoxin domain-containing protein [Bailinhaonella thermotolerans]RJL24692.1 protein-disulfide isomerase [Bailinhaonella thermotolerans]
MSKTARTSAREKVRAEREREQRRAKRQRQIVVPLVVLVVVAAVVGIGFYMARKGNETGTYAGGLAPVTVQPDGSVVMAKPGVEKPVVEIYEDFQCPGCKELERVNGATFKQLAAEGKAKVVYRPLTIFDPSQKPIYEVSVRGAAAARCVPGDKWVQYHDKLYENQPVEGKQGFTPDELIEYGKQVGVTGAEFEGCVRNQTHAQAHIKASDELKKSGGLQGTPTVKINGQDVGNQAFTADGLKKAVADATK